jgi:hypothetical protein
MQPFAGARRDIRVSRSRPLREDGLTNRWRIDVSEQVRGEVAERLRRRYPRSWMPRPVAIALIAILSGLALWWLVATALHHARPVAAARVSAYTVRSDTRMAITMTVDRLDPTVAVTCRLVAQAQDYQIVGERAVRVPSSTVRLLNVNIELVTLRRATSADVKGCTTG